MKKLDPNWLTEGLIDFEYKKYVLLAYLKNVKDEFNGRKLYPFLADLVFHYQNLVQIRENKKLMYDNFPQRISHADFKKLQIAYKRIVEDDEAMREIEDIVHYAIPRINHVLKNGKEIYEEIEQKLEVSPVGVLPMYSGEGYLLLSEYLMNQIRIYQYQVTIFESTGEKYRGINTEYLETVRRGLGETYENIKIGLVRRYRHLPNPAAFVVAAKVPCPLEESLLPIAKRVLVKYISKMAA
jgi:hypothetical protein